MVFVPPRREGFTITPIKTMGGQETNELHLDDVRVPEERPAGAPRATGWLQLMAGLNYERTILAATSLGPGAALVRRHAGLRQGAQQFGRPVGSFQALQHRLADMATDLAQARLLVRWVARL
jgi:alkylation response protein AidB-like acyl-CoA dehydrogenase